MKRDELIKSLFLNLEKNKESQHKLRIEEQSIHQKLNSIKNEIEFENEYIIGKFANVYHKKKTFKCKCTSIKCLDDFTVKPFFCLYGKQIDVDYYEWIQ